MKRLLAACFLLAACGNDTAGPGPGSPDAQAPNAVPTYYQDVEPIFATNCAGCHTAGGIAPFAIDDPDTAIAYASRIKDETQAKTMPPWPPGGDTPALLHTRTLTQAQIDTIVAWTDGGAKLGDPNDPRPHDPPEVIDIGATAYNSDIGVDYVPDTSLSDDYRCFLVDLNVATAQMATGFEVTPGNRAIVHHVIVGLFDGADRANLQALDDESPDRAGWPCTGGLVPTDSGIRQTGQLGSWVPGVSAVAYPAGTGTPIQAGALAVIQVHYNLLGGSDPDRTKLGIAVASADAAPGLIRIGNIGMIKRNLVIPADDAAAVNSQALTVKQWKTLRGGQAFPSGHGYVMGVGGHMHLVGHKVTITRTTAAGATDTLLDIPEWSFHWQGQYQLAQPIEIANDDTLTIRCEYDNSNLHRLALGLDPDVAVSWGEGTTDEMCIGVVQVVDELP